MIIRKIAFVLLVSIIFLIGVWLGGRSLSRHKSTNPETKVSWLEAMAMEVIEAPSDLKAVLTDLSLLSNPYRAPECPLPKGKHRLLRQEKIPINKNLLFSYYAETDNQIRIEERHLSNNQLLYSWQVNIDTAGAVFDQWLRQYGKDFCGSPFFTSEWKERTHRSGVAHPLRFGQELIIPHPNYGPLLKLNKSSEIEWVSPFPAHHNRERGNDPGTFWFCSWSQCGKFRPEKDNDMIVKMNLEGEVLFKKRIDDIFRENPKHDLGSTCFDCLDKYHLNDLQPVYSSGPYWQKGDLFISLRNISTVFLYRPSTNKILWRKSTEWHFQHDVSVINDSTISVFNNNIRDNATEQQHSNYSKPFHNQILYYHFGADSVSEHFQKIVRKYNISTRMQGRFKLFNDSTYYIENTANCNMVFGDLRTGESYLCAIKGNGPGKASPLAWNRPSQPSDTLQPSSTDTPL